MLRETAKNIKLVLQPEHLTAKDLTINFYV